MRRLPLLLLLLLILFPSGCIWKLWTDDTPIEERVFDVYGTVESISPEELVVQNRGERLTFRMLPSSVKGSDFGAGTYVHVYYHLRGEGGTVKEVTMVVEKR